MLINETDRAIDILSEELVKLLGIILTEEQKEKFKIYMQELLKWNAKINLTAITGYIDIAIKHFFDSILYFAYAADGLTVNKKGRELFVVDIGSGAGFPGIPILLINQNIRLTVIEKSRKKCSFLFNLISKLSLQQRVTVLYDQVENVAEEKLFPLADIVLVRALRLDAGLMESIKKIILPEGGIIYGLGKKDFSEYSRTSFSGFSDYTVVEKTFTLPLCCESRRIITLTKS